MAKDRNTVAKRQREMEKKRKANEKRERRAKRKQQSEDAESDGSEESSSPLSPAEHAVLSVFRKYLMIPGKMLCFNNADLESFARPLAELTSKQLLVVERFRGGYSLTESGFAAMQAAD